MKRDNKGLTIIELIVGVAILSIVGIAICGFIMVGTKQFAVAQAEVNLQYEAQLVSNQINDIMVEAVAFNHVDGSNVYAIVSRTEDADASTQKPTFKANILEWNTADSTLKYTTYPVTYNKTANKYDPAGTSKSGMMGEYIENFEIKLSANTASENNAGLRAKLIQDLKQRERKFHLESNIFVRNSVAINSAIISGPGGDDAALGDVTGLVITPVSAILPPGGSQQFKATVKATGKVDTTVNWSILEPDVKTGTKVSATGRLTIADDEALDKVTVVASLASKPSISKTATVSIKDVDSVVISPEPESIEQNMSFKLTATVSGRNISDSPQDQAVKWRIVEGTQYVSMTGANSFKVSAITPVGTKVTISATSAVNPKKSASRTFSVKKATGSTTDPEDEDGDVTFTSWSEYINRGGSGTFKIKNDVPNSSISWKVNVFGKNGTKDVTYKEGTAYVVSASGTSCSVKITKAIDFEREAKVMVTAIVTPNGKGEAEAKQTSVTATVKPVSMVLMRHESDTPRKAITGIRLYYLKNTKTNYLYELEGIENEDVSWRGPNYDKKILGLKMDSKKKTVTLSVPSEKSTGSATALAYIDNYPLGCSISATVATGNVYYKETTYDSAGKAHDKITWLYFPTPSEKEFPWSTSSTVKEGEQQNYYAWPDVDNVPNSENMKAIYHLDTSVKPNRWYIALTPTGESWRVGSCRYYCIITGNPETEEWKQM